MKVSIIIVSWNVREDLIRCLGSIKKNQPGEEFETIVIDNGSTDGTVEAVARNFPEVVMLTNNENRGFAAANNQGIETAKGQYILLLSFLYLYFLQPPGLYYFGKYALCSHCVL